MAIKNGDLADADEVLNNLLGTPFKNQAQLLYNAAHIGFNSKLNVATGAPNLKNIKYDIMTGDSASTKTNIFYNSTDDLYDTEIKEDGSRGFTIDEFNDSSVSTSIWDVVTSVSGSVTESTSQITINSNASGSNGYAQVTSDNGMFNTYGDLIIAKLDTFQVSGDATPNGLAEIRITDGTNTTTLKGFASPNNANGTYFLMKKSGNTVSYKWTKSGDDAWADTSVAGWGDIKIQFYVYGSSIASRYGTIVMDFIRYNQIAGDATLIFQTSSLPTITDCIATWNSLIDGDNTLTVSISADGTNYEEVTDATIHRFTNTGTNLYVKFVITRVDTAAVDKISEYAILYNTGAV